MVTPLQSKAEVHDREAFLAIMRGFSRPGEYQYFDARDSSGIERVGKALLDIQTRHFCPDQRHAELLAQTGSRHVVVEGAQYLFFPKVEAHELEEIADAYTGSLMYPDTSATIIANCNFSSGTKLLLSGPGIASSCEVQVGEIPPALWRLRNEKNSFPQGWDLILLHPNENQIGLICIPRSSKVEVLS